MVVVSHARAFASNSQRRQAALRNAYRKRRDSIRAIPRLHQTRLLGVGLTPVALTDAFPAGAASRPVTFTVDLEVTGTPSGTILNVGDGNPALTVYYDAGTLKAVVGSGTVAADAVSVTATRPHTGGRVTLVVSVRPGDGSIRIWDQCGLLAQGEASSGSIASWSGESGSDLIVTYGAAAGFNTLISDPGAPSGFGEINPTRGYALYNPQHHLNNIPDEVVVPDFDEFLYRATFINYQIELFPLLDDSE